MAQKITARHVYFSVLSSSEMLIKITWFKDCVGQQYMGLKNMSLSKGHFFLGGGVYDSVVKPWLSYSFHLIALHTQMHGVALELEL